MDPNIYNCISKVDQYFHSKTFDQTRLEFIRHSDEEKKSMLFNLNNYFRKSLFFAISMSNRSFISEETFKRNVAGIVPSIPMEECKLKLGIIAMDLNNAQQVVFQQGNLLENTLASCAIPGVFAPVEIDSRILVDGSWINPIPVDLAYSLGADFVIASDITPKMSDDIGAKTGLQISLRASEASRQAIKRSALEKADVTISVDLLDLHWADFSQVYRCIAKGKQETNQIIDEIKKKIARKKRNRWFM